VPEQTVAAFCSAVQRSYDWAQEHRLKLDPLLLQHSQEKLPSVIDSHIALYITAETRALTEMGQRAFQTLFDWSYERGLLPHRIASCLA
jgi:predicted solute-binding protein